MPKPTFENLPEDKRRRLVDVAEEEFAQHAYETASLSRIARDAGIAKGSLYQYFENKLDLYCWLLEQAGKRKFTYIEGGPVPEPGRFFDWIESALWGALRFGRAEPRMLRLSQSAYSATAAPELRALNAQWRRQGHAMFKSFLEQAQAAGEVRDDVDAGAAAHVVLNVIGHGLMDMLADAAGTDVMGLLSSGSLGSVHDDDLARIVASVVSVLRGGLGSAERHEAGSER